MPKSSLWANLEHRAASAPATENIFQKKAKNQPTSTINLFQLLDERANVENLKPDVIESAVMEEVVENSVLTKAKRTTTKVNLLNTTMYVVTNPQTNQYFRLDEKEKFLWENMDGQHTIRDLALEYFNHYGAFAYEKIVELVFDLKKKTFLTENYVDIYSELSVWSKSKTWLHQVINSCRKFMYWDFPIKNVDRFFGQLYTHFFRFFFSKLAVLAVSALTIMGVVAFVIESRSSSYSLLHANNSLVGGIGLLFLFNFISLFIHEVAHGVATKHYGRSVHKAGFLLYFGLPSFYVDTTDMWLENAKSRIMVSIIGPFTGVLISGLISLGLLFFPVSPLSALLYKFAFVTYLSFFVNLNPLVEWDGYFIFMDLLGIPCLRRRSLYFIKNSLLSKIFKRESFNREEKIYTVFGVLAAFWSVIAIIWGLDFWRTELVHLLFR